MSEAQKEIPTEVVEAVSLANYLSVTRAAGLPDSLAEETYAKNKDSADRLTEFQLKHDIKKGDQARALIGHNSGETKDVDGVGGQRLKVFIERIERLEEEKSALMEDIKEIYAEAKSTGFDTKTIRSVVRLRKMDAEKRREAEDLLDIYKHAIGLV